MPAERSDDPWVSGQHGPDAEPGPRGSGECTPCLGTHTQSRSQSQTLGAELSKGSHWAQAEEAAVRRPAPPDSGGPAGAQEALSGRLSESVEVSVAHSSPTHGDHTDCSPPGSSVHGILQARILEWGAIPHKLNPVAYKEDYTPWPAGTSLRMQSWFNIQKSKLIYRLNAICTKIQLPFFSRH